MSIQASEAFGLFLTALRNAGVEIMLSDRDTAHLIIDALDTIDPDDGAAAVTCDLLRIELFQMIEQDLLVDDNGPDVDTD